MNAMTLLAAAVVLSMTACVGFADDEKAKPSEARVLRIEAGDAKMEFAMMPSHRLEINAKKGCTFDVKDNAFIATGSVVLVVRDDRSAVFTLRAETMKVLLSEVAHKNAAGERTITFKADRFAKTSSDEMTLSGNVVITFPTERK